MKINESPYMLQLNLISVSLSMIAYCRSLHLSF